MRTPGNVTYADFGGGLLEDGLCEPMATSRRRPACRARRAAATRRPRRTRTTTPRTASLGFFAQDRWKVNSWLRINPGMRFDYGRTTNSLGEVVSNLFGFGPRIGLVFDITQDQKTIFTAYYGRSNEVLSLLTAAYADVSALSTTYEYKPELAMGKGGWQKAYESGGPGGYTPPDGTPHTDEITLSLRREAFQNSMIGIDYTYKRVGNIWDSKRDQPDPGIRPGQRVVRYMNGPVGADLRVRYLRRKLARVPGCRLPV